VLRIFVLDGLKRPSIASPTSKKMAPHAMSTRFSRPARYGDVRLPVDVS
jgi:hypothetical protein